MVLRIEAGESCRPHGLPGLQIGLDHPAEDVAGPFVEGPKARHPLEQEAIVQRGIEVGHGL
jgi:hypothetical protein